MGMGYAFYNEYYNLGLFTAENLNLFVEVGMLDAADRDKILGK